MTSQKAYIGRFAPSPTGPLHLGSLYAALASFLHARANQGKWLLRIDDSDSFRNVKGATENIIDTLHNHGLIWDDAIYYQSRNLIHYQSFLTQLQKQKHIYPCVCTRKALITSGFSIYPKICQHLHLKQNQPHALRIKSKDIQLFFEDELQGYQSHQLDEDDGDFIIRRKDTIIAYQLAVVIDDYQQKITHVVRGFDLLDSTPKQLFLQSLLGFPMPNYCHIPIITDHKGDKLSKQTFAQDVSKNNVQNTLFLLLSLLEQNPPTILKKASVNDIINWGIENWQPSRLKKIRAIADNID